jgi:molybdopterin-guanine dinucleotide biosynthesis protein A
MMRAEVMEGLVRFTQAGERKIDRWTAQQRTQLVAFDDAEAFANANTTAELHQLHRDG